MGAKLKVLQILDSFFECAQTRRITRLVEFWEEMLARLGVESQRQLSEIAQRAKTSQGSALTSKQSALDPDIHRGRRRSLPRKSVADCSMEALVLDAQQWSEAPPWSDEELKALAEEMSNTESMLADGFSHTHIQAMFATGNVTFVPDWIKVLLDLIRYENAALKERSIATLLTTFSTHPNFIARAQSTILVWESELVEKHLRVRTETTCWGNTECVDADGRCGLRFTQARHLLYKAKFLPP
mmetsp:Transcript_21718/g.44132  ORF Transcript_21718/g.44132 Transcript_21718/m.44132 type:complete len:242 (+) Transcript_21718:130-855(+)